MRILVTGSDGFIGTHLCAELRSAGHIVHGMDIKQGPIQDASNSRRLREIFEEQGTEVVVHLAGESVLTEVDVARTITSNAGMTAVVAQECGTAGIRLVYASSSDVYGDSGDIFCRELAGPWRPPNSIYGLSKLWGEQVAQLYCPERFTALRFYAPYGPGLTAGRGRPQIVNLLWLASHDIPLADQPIIIDQETSWCWIGDAVRGARIAIEQSEGPINIGRDDAFVRTDVVARIACELAETSKEIGISVGRDASPRISNERLRSFGWEPAVELIEGMRSTLDWVESLDESGEPERKIPNVKEMV